MDLEENRDVDMSGMRTQLEFLPSTTSCYPPQRRLDRPHTAHMSRDHSDFGLGHAHMSRISASGLNVVGRIRDLTVLLPYTAHTSPLIVHRCRLPS